MAADQPSFSREDNVTSLHGGVVNKREPNESCIRNLRELLEKAEAGEITGFACSCLHGDNTASYTIAGLVGPYSLLGATDMARDELMDLMKAQRADHAD